MVANLICIALMLVGNYLSYLIGYYAGSTKEMKRQMIILKKLIEQ